MKYSIGIFGGVAATSIIYFMLIKGLKDSSLMTGDLKTWVYDNTWLIIGMCFLFFSILMQILHILKVNVFKVIVLLGTFALALAFAGNDLVNFIGVPLAGYSSYIDLINQPGATPDGLLMTSLLGSAHTPWYFLIGAGGIMVYALCTSKKAQNVIKTSVNLSRQDEGEEVFGSTPAARTLVRISLNASNSLMRVVPVSVKSWIDSRFRKDEAILADGAAFDLVRASVNLVLAGLLIAVGTSLKLPLSTTYVTFMVAMGTLLADRAWGRDSAVYRITGVLSVIGGWFLTAGAAFTFCFIVTLILKFGGPVAAIVLVGIAAFSLVRSQISYKKKSKKVSSNPVVSQLIKSEDSNEILELLRENTREELTKLFTYAGNNFDLAIDSCMDENLRGLRKVVGAIKFEKSQIKQAKRIGTIAMSHMDHQLVLDKGLYYYQGCDFAAELMNSLGRICDNCIEHIGNNFNPLDETQKVEFLEVSRKVTDFIEQSKTIVETNNYDNFIGYISSANGLNNELSRLKKEELNRIQSQSNSIKVSMMYLTLIQETQNMVNCVINILKVTLKFEQQK